MHTKNNTSRLVEIEKRDTNLTTNATKASYFVTQNRDISPDEIIAYTSLFGSKNKKSPS